MENTLCQVFERNLQYQARWNTCLANHVSMAAAAMYLMRDRAEVTEGKILADADRYTSRLSPLRLNDSAINICELPENVQDGLVGTDDLQESWQTFFKQVFSEDIDAGIGHWLNRLGAGLSAAAGHSVLRIYFALAVRKSIGPDLLSAELAAGFSDLASRYCELTAGESTGGTAGLADYLGSHTMISDPDAASVQAGMLMEDRFLILRSLESFRSAVGGINLDYDLEETLRLLASIAAKEPNIGSLHSITVGQALLELFEADPTLDGAALRRGYRDYIVAIVQGYSLPDADAVDGENVTLEKIYARVPHLENDHSQKVTYALGRLYERSGHGEFLVAADRFQALYG